MYRTLLGIGLSIAAALLLVGLSFSSTAGKPADFRFINGTEPSTLDPGVLSGQPGGRIAVAVFEGLTRRDAESRQAAPGVAESWTISDDQTEYTFRLRKDARWSDGHPVTAHDFVYSWKRALSPELGSEYAYILHMVRLAEEFNTYAGRAQSLRGPIPEALRALRKQHPAGLPAKAWQSFVAEHGVSDAVKGAQVQGDDAPIFRRLLGIRQGSVSSAELDEFSELIERAAKRLTKAHAHAIEHFGKDEGLFARSDHELIVQLNAPTAYFLEVTSFYTALPVPRWLVEKPGLEHNWFLPETIVSNGPFQLESWRVNDRIRLIRSESYWGKERVKLRHLEALSIENATSSLNLYLTGEVDWLPSLYPQDLVDQLKTREDFYQEPGWVTYFYRFNCTKPPFDDARVRHALNLAVDRQVLVKEVMRLGQKPAYYFVPEGIPGYRRPATQLSFDVQRARQLLAQAGYPDGKGFPEVGILYNTNEGHKKIGEFIADQLRRNLGIQVKAYNQEWQSFLATVRSGDYDMARAGWIGDYLDPNTFLDMWVTNGGNNQTGFSSEKYDRLIDAAADVVNAIAEPEALQSSITRQVEFQGLLEQLSQVDGPKQRAEKIAQIRLFLLAEAEGILVGEAHPIMPLYFYVVSGLVRPEIGGFFTKLKLPDGSLVPNVDDEHPLDAIFRKPEAP